MTQVLDLSRHHLSCAPHLPPANLSSLTSHEQIEYYLTLNQTFRMSSKLYQILSNQYCLLSHQDLQKTHMTTHICCNIQSRFFFPLLLLYMEKYIRLFVLSSEHQQC